MSPAASNAEGKKEPNSDSAPAKLRVSHPDEGDYTSRGIHLSLDGKRFATLKSGKRITLEIEPGEHSLQADNTFSKKAETFAAGAGETVRYVTHNRAGFGSSLIGILGAGPLYLVLEREAEGC
jgi:hypothetical protein